MKILLIEDNPGDARLIQEMLSEVKDFPFELEWCDRLSKGLSCLARERVGVVLLDLTLPDSQGLDTFEHVVHHAPGVPIIVLTILADEMTGLKAVEKGAQDYLFKGGVDGHLLVRSIRYATGRKQVEEALWVSHRFLEISNRHTEMAPLLQECVTEIKRFTGCDAVGIRILDEDGSIPYRAYDGFGRESLWHRESCQPDRPLSIKSDQCICIQVMKGKSESPFYTEGGSFFVNNATRFLATVSEKEKGKTHTLIYNQEGYEQEGYESVALIPIRLDKQTLGVIHVADHQEGMLPRRTVKILEEVALQLSTAIQRVQLEEIRRKNERALAESEERYRSFVQNFHGIAFRSDTNFEPLFLHGDVEAITGYTEDEFTAGHVRWDQIVHPDDLPGFYEKEEEIRSRRHYSGEREYRIIRKDGQVRWTHESVQNICDYSGRPILVQGAIYDITERKRVEEEVNKYRFHLEELVKERTSQLTAANEQLQQEIGERKQAEGTAKLAYAELNQIFKAAVDGMCVISKELEILRVNETFCTLFGLGRDEVTGKNCSEVFPQDLCRTISCPVDVVLKGEERFESDVEIDHKDGHKVSCILSAIPFRSPNGELIGIVENFKDITERKRMEDELQRAQRLESLGVLAGGIAHDFNNILGSIIGSFSLLKLHARAGDRFFDWLTKAEKAAFRARDLTQQLLTFSKGGRAPAKKTISISELLEETVSFSSRGSKVKCEFAMPDNLWPVEADVGQISQVINNLTINAIEAMPRGGTISIHAENVVIDGGGGRGRVSEGSGVRAIEVRDEGIGTSRASGEGSGAGCGAGSASGEGSGVGCGTSRTSGEGSGAADERGGASHLVSRARAGLPMEEGRYVKVSIQDQGIGIPRENLQRVFDPYFTTKQTGTGLGLANSYSIIKKHGGYITAESEVGVGTTFHIYLPASEQELFAVKEIVEEGFLPGQGKILFMDDQQTIRDMVGEMLMDLGYEVEFAREGSEAIEFYEQAQKSGQAFDAVILDLTVPGGMGGQEAIQRLREIDPAIKAIVSSGYSNDQIMTEYQEHGFCGAIAKPYEIKELARVLSKTLMGTEGPCLKG
jgi:PAS domain S-box-containing protein